MTDHNSNPQADSANVAALAPLRALLADTMPILDANLSAAHREYMDGDIPKGAFDYVLGRHANAAVILSNDAVSLEDALQACARMTGDVRTGCRDAKSPDVLERWMTFLRSAGFTEENRIFGWPTRPARAA